MRSISYCFYSVFTFKVIISISFSLVKNLNIRNYVLQNVLTNFTKDVLGPTIFQLICSLKLYFLNQWRFIVFIQISQSVFMIFIYHKLLNCTFSQCTADNRNAQRTRKSWNSSSQGNLQHVVYGLQNQIPRYANFRSLAIQLQRDTRSFLVEPGCHGCSCGWARVPWMCLWSYLTSFGIIIIILLMISW